MEATVDVVMTEENHRRLVWTPEMRERLRQEYVPMKDANRLPELANALGVDLYQLYGQAHRLGLTREIRRR